jgi:hypothetical protein
MRFPPNGVVERPLSGAVDMVHCAVHETKDEGHGALAARNEISAEQLWNVF